MTDTSHRHSRAFDDALQYAGQALLTKDPVQALVRVLMTFRDAYRAEVLAEVAAPAVVEPPVDRAAVLREAADRIDATFTGPGLDRYTRYGADLLRRMADEREAADAYARRLNAPLSLEACQALRERLESGTAPRRRVRRMAGETAATCRQCGDTGACNGGPCPLPRPADETVTTEAQPSDALSELEAAARALELDRDAASTGESRDYRRGMTRAVQVLRLLDGPEPAAGARQNGDLR